MNIEISDWKLPKYRRNIKITLPYKYIRFKSINNKGNSIWCIEACEPHEHRNKSKSD